MNATETGKLEREFKLVISGLSTHWRVYSAEIFNREFMAGPIKLTKFNEFWLRSNVVYFT